MIKNGSVVHESHIYATWFIDILTPSINNDLETVLPLNMHIVENQNSGFHYSSELRTKTEFPGKIIFFYNSRLGCQTPSRNKHA